MQTALALTFPLASYLIALYSLVSLKRYFKYTRFHDVLKLGVGTLVLFFATAWSARILSLMWDLGNLPPDVLTAALHEGPILFAVFAMLILITWFAPYLNPFRYLRKTTSPSKK